MFAALSSEETSKYMNDKLDIFIALGPVVYLVVYILSNRLTKVNGSLANSPGGILSS